MSAPGNQDDSDRPTPGPEYVRPPSAGPVPEESVPEESVPEAPDRLLPPPAQQRPAPEGPSVTVLVLGVVLTLVAAIALVLGRPIERLLEPTTDETSTAPTAPADPTDPIAHRLTRTGMRCVRAAPGPTIRVCLAPPGGPHSDIRWLSSPTMTEYRFYHRADSTDDQELLTRRLEAFTVGGLSIDDVSKIEDGMERSRRQHEHTTVRADWGVMEIEYIDTLSAFQIKGRMDGETEQTVAATPFVGGRGAVEERLEPDGFDCRDNGHELICESGDVSLHLYRTSQGSDTFDYLSAYPRSGRDASASAAAAVAAIVDVIVDRDAALIREEIDTHTGAGFHLAAVGSVLIKIEPAVITLEALGW